MKPLDLEEIGRKHKLAMLNTATGRVLALACCEIEELRAKAERLQADNERLTAALQESQRELAFIVKEERKDTGHLMDEIEAIRQRTKEAKP